eukprot:5043546-Amphidinium_carterae.2
MPPRVLQSALPTVRVYVWLQSKTVQCPCECSAAYCNLQQRACCGCSKIAQLHFKNLASCWKETTAMTHTIVKLQNPSDHTNLNILNGI